MCMAPVWSDVRRIGGVVSLRGFFVLANEERDEALRRGIGASSSRHRGRHGV